jgi:hypothetical protein
MCIAASIAAVVIGKTIPAHLLAAQFFAILVLCAAVVASRLKAIRTGDSRAAAAETGWLDLPQNGRSHQSATAAGNASVQATQNLVAASAHWRD